MQSRFKHTGIGELFDMSCVFFIIKFKRNNGQINP